MSGRRQQTQPDEVVSAPAEEVQAPAPAEVPKVVVVLVGPSRGAEHGDRREVTPERAERLIANGLAVPQDDDTSS